MIRDADDAAQRASAVNGHGHAGLVRLEHRAHHGGAHQRTAQGCRGHRAGQMDGRCLGHGMGGGEEQAPDHTIHQGNMQQLVLLFHMRFLLPFVRYACGTSVMRSPTVGGASSVSGLRAARNQRTA